MKTNKSTTKKRNYNAEALLILQRRYGYSMNYIQKSLRGDRVGTMPDVLIREYNQLVHVSEQALLKKEKELNG